MKCCGDMAIEDISAQPRPAGKNPGRTCARPIHVFTQLANRKRENHVAKQMEEEGRMDEHQVKQEYQCTVRGISQRRVIRDRIPPAVEEKDQRDE